MKMGILTYLPVVSCVLAVTCCGSRDLKNALDNLDATLDKAELYRETFTHEMDALTLEFESEQDDSTLWEMANRIYSKYIYYDIDKSSYFVDKMQEYSSRTGIYKQQFMTQAALARIFRSKGNYSRAIQVFDAIDPTEMDQHMRNRYYSTGLGLYMYLSEQDDSCSAYRSRVASLRKDYFSADSTSFHSVNMQALWHRDEGRYDKALKLLEKNLSRASSAL